LFLRNQFIHLVGIEMRVFPQVRQLHVANRDFAGSLLSPEELSPAQIRAAKLHEEILQRKAQE
jgi:hypothetical protein